MKDDDDENGLFESVGKAADKISETSVGKKIGTVLTVILLAVLSGGANLTILDQYFNGDHDEGPIGAVCNMTLLIITRKLLMMTVVVTF